MPQMSSINWIFLLGGSLFFIFLVIMKLSYRKTYELTLLSETSPTTMSGFKQAIWLW